MGINQPGVPGSQLPPGEDHVMRRLANLERAYKELIAASVPIMAQSILFNTTNFAIPFVTGGMIASQNVVVPAGFTSAIVHVLARCRGVNPYSTGGADGKGADYLAMVAQINGMQSGIALSTWIDGSGKSAVGYTPFANMLAGLVAGATFNLSIWAAMTYNALPANPVNMAEMSGTILWLH